MPESIRFPLWGGTAVVIAGERTAIGRAHEAVLATIDEFDRACSRFRADSELSSLNRTPSVTVRVSPLLSEAVSQALRAARLTDGDVDPTVGEALISLGYDRDFELVEGPRTIRIARVPGWHAVALNPQQQTIRLDRGVMLDLGATAKALAADRAAERAAAAADCPVLVSLSGDISTAGGAPPDGWPIRVTDDHRADVTAPGQWITLTTGGLATSSTTVRAWRAGERSVHHLIDPATGSPAEVVWRTASVAAATCLDANIASTAAIIRGQEAVPWLDSLALPSRLVSATGRVVRVAGWPAEGDDLEPARAAA